MRAQVFLVVMLCCWVSGFGCFKGKYYCNLEDQAVQEGLFYYFFFEKSGTTNPTTRRHIAEVWNPQPHLRENLKCSSIRIKYIAESFLTAWADVRFWRNVLWSYAGRLFVWYRARYIKVGRFCLTKHAVRLFSFPFNPDVRVLPLNNSSPASQQHTASP
jgi:hypothetical protein